MEFRYIGDQHGDGPEVTTAFGITFRKGEATTVDGRFHSVVKKLRGNPHFEEIEDKPAKKSPAKKPAAKR